MAVRQVGAREKIKFTPTLTAYGDELREAALAGCGIVRLLACHVEDEIRSGALLPVLPDWECLGGLPIVAIYRKTSPALSPVNAFVGHLAQAFQRYNDYATHAVLIAAFKRNSLFFRGKDPA